MSINRRVAGYCPKWLLCVLGLALLTACSNSSDGVSATGSATTPAPSTTVSAATTTPEESLTPSPSASATPESLASRVGGLVYTEYQEQDACAEGTSTGESDPQSSVTARQLLRGGRLLLGCGDTRRVMVDLATGNVVWRLDETEAEGVVVTSFIGSQNLLRVIETPVEATGLRAASITAQLQAIDLSTGETRWTTPLASGPANTRMFGSGQKVREDAANWRSAHGLVFVTRDGYAAYDMATGKAMWKARDTKGTYVADGVALEEEFGNLTATDVPTGKALWTKSIPEFISSNEPSLLDGPVAWWIASRGVYAVDLRTGRQVLNRLYPTSWEEQIVTPDLTLAFDGKQVQAFRTADLRTPLWSTPAENVTPLAITSTMALVRAEAGIQVLSTSDGSILTSALTPPQLEQSAVVDGLAIVPDGVYELSPPSAT